MRNVLLKLHLVVALVAGAFLVVLGTTGAIMAFEDELSQLFHPALYRASAGPPLPIAALVKSALAAYPGEKVMAVSLPEAPGKSTVLLAERHAIFVDGATGRVLGALDGPGFLGVVHQIHLRLVPGTRWPVVRVVLGVSSIGLFLLVVSGAVLWWRRRIVTVGRGGSPFRRAFDLHHAVGAWSGLFLLLSSLTGAAMAWDDDIARMAIQASKMKPAPRMVPSAPLDGAPTIAPERAIEAARAALPGATPIMVSIPRRPLESYNVRMRFPSDRTPGGRSWVVVDRFRATPLATQDARKMPAALKALTLARAIHTGDVFGNASAAVMSLSSLLLVVQTISGLLIWRRRPRAGAQELERAA